MERLRTFDDPALFRKSVADHLLAKEAENNLIFGILGSIERGRYPEYLLAALERDGDIAAVAVRTPPFPLVLAFSSPEEARALARAIPEPLSGVNGEVSQASAFAEAWSERSGWTVRKQMAQRIYALRSVRAPSGVSGSARVASEDDRSLLVRWFDAFSTEALPAGDPRVTPLDEQVTIRIREGSVLLWEDGGVPVSLAAFGGPSPNGIRIGPVYTPPGERRRGYAGALVAELSRRQLEAGRRFCFLYTDLANPTSNSVYQRIGYEPVCDVDVYRFLEPERSSGGNLTA